MIVAMLQVGRVDCLRAIFMPWLIEDQLRQTPKDRYPPLFYSETTADEAQTQTELNPKAR